MALLEMNWEQTFARQGAFWKHDGNKKRPYARLTSGRISDKFFNGGRVIKSPALLERAVGHLIHSPSFAAYLNDLRGSAAVYRAPSSLSDPTQIDASLREVIGRVVGPPYGATTLMYELGRHLGWEIANPIRKTRKNEDDEEIVVPGEFSLERSAEDFRENELVLLCEDTLTTGKSVRALRKAVSEACPTAQFMPFVMTLCNRSGESHIDKLEIVSLISPDMSSWEEGKNPYTPDGKELVPPVKAKGEGWKLLTQAYD